MATCTNNDLRKARETRDLTRDQLAMMVNVSSDTIERWERGASHPTPDDVDNIARATDQPHLWHDWMCTHYTSYARRHPMNGIIGGSIALSMNYYSRLVNPMYFDAYTPWHSDNDGSGSGMDSDKVDGLDGTQLLPFRTYNYVNGFLVRTDIPASEDTMMTLTITGNGYSALEKNIFIVAQLYNYASGNSIIYYKATALDYCPVIYAFNYDSKIYFWIDSPGNYCSLMFFVQSTVSGIPYNRVTSVADEDKPTSGVTREVSFTPNQVYHSGNREAVTEISSFTENWVNYGSGRNNAGYCKRDNRVYLQGV